ncbi:MAG TPA: ice-binding family protein [Acidimicrobiales bacterium]|nr:ice-binding family protein [Acidimicrobiales bacterium]
MLALALVTGLVAPLSLLLSGPAGAAAVSVPLGTAESFGVLAGAGMTNTGPTTINGDVGTYPTTTETGTGSLTVNGTNHAGDAVTQQAKTDLVTAYGNAARQGPTSPVTADLGGQALTAGVYNSASSLGLTGTLTLNGQGNAGAVFVFQAGSTLTTASASQVVLINGAQSCNVFWQIGSSATLGTSSKFVGTVLALQSITVTTSVTVDGRVLARNGAVTLDSDTITASRCAAATATTVTTTPSGATAGSVTATTAPGTTATTTATAAAAAKATVAKAAKTARKRARARAAAKAAAATKAAKPVSFAKPARAHVGFTG